jgi:hypothetical protein
MDRQQHIIQNIVRFEGMIAREADAGRLARLRDLLAEEHDKLFALHRRNTPR